MTGIISTHTPRVHLGSAQQELSATRDVEATGKQVESMFASMLIKSLRETLGEDGLFPGDKSDALGSLFDQFMGEEIARGQGLGLAKAISAYTASATGEETK